MTERRSPVGQGDFLILDPGNLSGYLDERPALAARVGRVTAIETPEDGNINRVFVVKGEAGSLALKQGLPWVRIIESWELTAERTAREANFFAKWAPYAEGLLPEIFEFDEENHVIAMEDLSGFRIMAEALGREDHGSNVERIGRLLARAFLGTSPFFLGPIEFSERLRETENPELAELMEQVVFDHPWNAEPLDHCHPDLRGPVTELLGDEAFMSRVGELKYRFRTAHEGLIHGDLHTGSVMVAGDEIRVFDAEFARYGPVAWDVGEFIAHLRIAAVAAVVSGQEERAEACASLPGRFWSAFAVEVREGWGGREDRLFSDGFVEAWLADQERASARFAGAEIGRRMIGVGKAALIESLPEGQMLTASHELLAEARQLVKEGVPSWL